MDEFFRCTHVNFKVEMKGSEDGVENGEEEVKK